MSQWRKRIPAILFLGAASYVFLRSHVYRAPSTVDVASLGLHLLDGAPVPLTAVRGKPLVLNFWAPWCPPCRVEMPWLDHLQKQHPGIAVIGLEDDADAVEQARELTLKSNLSYMLVLPNNRVRQKFGSVAALPTTLYVSSSGRVIHTVTGIVPESVMNDYLHDTIAAR